VQCALASPPSPPHPLKTEFREWKVEVTINRGEFQEIGVSSSTEKKAKQLAALRVLEKLNYTVDFGPGV
jgi:hypothetical protein